MDDEGEEGDGFRSSTAPNTRRRIVTRTPSEENKGDEGTVAVTQESLDGIREKALRIVSLDEMGASSSARVVGPGGAEIDKTKKAKEIVWALVGSITEEVDFVVARDSKSKLWKRRGFEESNAHLEHEVCRHSEESKSQR